MTIDQLLKAGNLTDALNTAASAVKADAKSEQARALFVELLCINGEFERADAQLNTLINLNPELGLGLAHWRQLIKAAQTRVDVFSLQSKPDLVEQPTANIAAALDRLVAIREQDQARLQQLAVELEAEDINTLVAINKDKPAIMRDVDDITANVFEVLGTNGKYFWLDYNQIQAIEVSKPTRAIELIWRKAAITLTNGSEGEVYIPAIYPTKGDEKSALGIKTDWQEQHGIFTGVGLKTWLVGDDQVTINQLKRLLPEASEDTATYTAVGG